MEIFLIVSLVGSIFLYKYIEIEKLKKTTGKVAYILEEYGGCTIKAMINEPYYNVSHDHSVYIETLLETIGIDSYYINSCNYKRVKSRKLKFCEDNNWINKEDKEDIDKKLNKSNYFKENRFRFHNRKQKENFLKGIPFNQFTF